MLNMGFICSLIAGNFWEKKGPHVNNTPLSVMSQFRRVHHLYSPTNLSPDVASERAALHRQRSLPHRPPVIPLVARMADQNTSGTLAMTEREASRLDKFKQLLAGPNTDLGKDDPHHICLS